VVALLAGIFLSLGTHLVLHGAHVFPPWGAPMVGYDRAILLATIYRKIFGVLGSYIAARLAPNRPLLHAVIFGFVGFAVSLLGLCSSNSSPISRAKDKKLKIGGVFLQVFI
jgi:hypothetical protein